MRTIYDPRYLLQPNLNRNVNVKVHGIRNKNDLINGTITECYPNVFIVNTKCGKRSFSYSDVLIGNIVVKIK